MQIVPLDYSQLCKLVPMQDPSRAITAEEAFLLYERNWKFVVLSDLSADEVALIERLEELFGPML